VRHWLLLVLAVQPRCDVVVEGKGVPGEPSSRPERGGDPLKGAVAYVRACASIAGEESMPMTR